MWLRTRERTPLGCISCFSGLREPIAVGKYVQEGEFLENFRHILQLMDVNFREAYLERRRRLSEVAR